MTGSRGGLAGWQKLLLLHPGVLGSAAGISGWVVEQCQPLPAVLGGIYEPREEALVKLWDLRASLAAKLAALCKGCEGLGARAPSASVFPKHQSVVVSSR